MRPIFALAFSAIVALSATSNSAARAADDQFDLAVDSGHITLTTHSGWHINKDYPWKVVAGDTKLDKTKFALNETTASIQGVPKGEVKLKGAVCSGDQCVPFERKITVQ